MLRTKFGSHSRNGKNLTKMQAAWPLPSHREEHRERIRILQQWAIVYRHTVSKPQQRTRKEKKRQKKKKNNIEKYINWWLSHNANVWFGLRYLMFHSEAGCHLLSRQFELIIIWNVKSPTCGQDGQDCDAHKIVPFARSRSPIDQKRTWTQNIRHPVLSIRLITLLTVILYMLQMHGDTLSTVADTPIYCLSQSQLGMQSRLIPKWQH